MAVRTDLALELSEGLNEKTDGVEQASETDGEIKITRIKITSEKGERAINRPIGEYITLEF